MPRLPKDYSKTIIYKICCNDVDVKECYVGHTTNFVKRKYSHKNNCIYESQDDYNMFVYQFIRQNGGWNCWEMVMIEEYPCENRFQAETRERYWIETLQSKLNKQIPTRTMEEWYKENKDKLAEKKKIYNKLRKEDKHNFNLKYYQENKLEIIKQTKQYYETHKAEIAEKQKKKYELHKEELTKKYTCECGSILSMSGKSHHNKTKKHLAFVNLELSNNPTHSQIS